MRADTFYKLYGERGMADLAGVKPDKDETHVELVENNRQVILKFKRPKGDIREEKSGLHGRD